MENGREGRSNAGRGEEGLVRVEGDVGKGGTR